AVMMVGGISHPERLRPSQHPAQPTAPLSVLRMKLVGSSESAKAEGADELEGKSNYFIGNDPSKWHTNVAQYAKVKYHNVYPGVDLVYYGNQGQLEHDFVIAPGADPKHIRLSIAGATKMSVNKQGALLMTMANGELQLKKPAVYQEIAGSRREIAGEY